MLALKKFSNTRSWLVLFVLLLVIRLPYLLTKHTADDTFIAYRTAFNLADHGQYAFNLGDPSSNGVTSIFLALIAALCRLVFGDWAVIAIPALGLAATLVATWFVAAALRKPDADRKWVWAMGSLMPVTAMAGYWGMEIFILIFAIGLALYMLRDGLVRWPFILCIFALPLIRPDAVVFGLILVTAAAFFNMRMALIALGALLAGVGLLTLFNILVTGSVVTNTITAKLITFKTDHGAMAVLERLVSVFFLQRDNYLLPIDTALLWKFGPLFSLLCYGCAAFVLWSRRHDKVGCVLTGALIFCMLLAPAAYAYSGLLMPWYFHAPRWAAYVLVADAMVLWARQLRPQQTRIFVAAALVILAAFNGIQFAVSAKQGLQETGHRILIGKYIGANSKPGDTLFLEPAGYIPFYSGLRTDDEVGLVSRSVVDYRIKYGKSWWIHYVKERRPTFIVERPHFLKWQTYSFVRDGSDTYTLTPDEIAWFKSNYQLVREFKFTLDVYTKSSYARLLKAWFGIDLDALAKGPMGALLSRFNNEDDYYVYRAI